MSLTQGSLIEASDIVALKASVKAEMLRRCYVGDLSATYGSSSYDYTIQPTANTTTASTEHITKIIEPLNAITNQGYTDAYQGGLISHLDVVAARLESYKGEALYGSSSCSSSCSGLCKTTCTGTCWNACTSCTDACTSCTANCKNDCRYSCTRNCAPGCWYQCSNCGSYCAIGCPGSCGGMN